VHEHYFTSCTDAPVVFNNLRDGELRHLCPGGELARSITTLFEPDALRITEDGRLFHPRLLSRPSIDTVGGPSRRERLMALIESTTAQRLLESCDEREEAEEDGASPAIVLHWDGRETRPCWAALNRILREDACDATLEAYAGAKWKCNKSTFSGRGARPAWPADSSRARP